MIHAALALLLQCILAPLFGWWAAACVPVALFIGREIAQAEYRWIEQFSPKNRAGMPWHAVYTDPRAWTRKGVADFLAPAVACGLMAWLAPF